MALLFILMMNDDLVTKLLLLCTQLSIIGETRILSGSECEEMNFCCQFLAIALQHDIGAVRQRRHGQRVPGPVSPPEFHRRTDARLQFPGEEALAAARQGSGR